MFTFHKPRVYRSTEGCCICRAKSSSSRFTDSKKYENDSMKCFNLKQPRFGEICNACVLLVKRYKRLPAGSNRHWGHVVDARTGPGTKSLTKYKKYKEDTDCSTTPTTTAGGGHHTTSYGSNSKSFITEKFSKIFKKNKKSKTNGSPSSLSSSSSSSTSSSGNSKRKSGASSSLSSNTTNINTQPWENHHHTLQHPSLPSTPDSLESDYEDGHLLTPTSAIVEFQTQTRASAFRSRNGKRSNAAGCSVNRRRAIKMSGSMRRKCMRPRKLLRAIFENDVQFFDEDEWQKRPSCCGPVYECAALGGAIIIDLDQYKPCTLHQRKGNAAAAATEMIKSQAMTQQSQHQIQKTIITTMPAVVQLTAASSSTTTTTTLAQVTTDTTKPTQVLKKHHLFFKRQSECFPHADLSGEDKTLIASTMTTTTTATPTPPAIKTDLHNSTSTTTTAISLKPISTDLAASTNLSLSSVQSMTTTHTNNNNNNTINPRHSVAKITSISSANTIVSNNYNNTNTSISTSSNKSTNFLHKIKAADSGKVVKNSLEKINTAVRLKPCEFNDMRNIIKTVDKSFVLNKSYTSQQVSAAAAAAQPVIQQHNPPLHTNISIVGPVNSNQLIANSTISAALSPTLSSSTISSLAPKFSDNSSDSGFDENLQDRKSASPLQEDNEKKMLTRPNIANNKKLYLTAGVNFYGPSQSMLLSGIDEAVNLRQKSRQQTTTASTTSHQRNHQNRLNTGGGGGGGVKIAQIVNSSSGGSHKMHMRALYNNNTIKHENGVTTILPASSLAASSQTAAMSALVAPSSVTITPAPTTAGTINGKKVSITGTSAQNINGTHGATIANSTHLNSISNQSLSSLNQKIIFVKTAKYGGGGNNQNVVQQANFHGNNSNSNINNKNNGAAGAVTTTMLNISQTQGVCKN